MTIETKFNINDTVYVLSGHRIFKQKVHRIYINVFHDREENSIEYSLSQIMQDGTTLGNGSEHTRTMEKYVFGSINDLLYALKNSLSS